MERFQDRGDVMVFGGFGDSKSEGILNILDADYLGDV